MKSSLTILALAVCSGRREVAPPPRCRPVPRLHGAKKSCTFATLPRATPAGQQSLYGHISSLTRKGNHYVLRFDPAWLLGG